MEIMKSVAAIICNTLVDKNRILAMIREFGKIKASGNFQEEKIEPTEKSMEDLKSVFQEDYEFR